MADLNLHARSQAENNFRSFLVFFCYNFIFFPVSNSLSNMIYDLISFAEAFYLLAKKMIC